MIMIELAHITLTNIRQRIGDEVEVGMRLSKEGLYFTASFTDRNGDVRNVDKPVPAELLRRAGGSEGVSVRNLTNCAFDFIREVREEVRQHSDVKPMFNYL